jgi:hypothetical protein
MLAEEIRKAKEREIIAALDHGEALIAAELKLQAPDVALTNDQGALLTAFVEWCAAKSVRRCPARPFTVAAHALHQKDAGVAPDRIIDTLVAIEALHNAYKLPNPCRTAIVDAALEQVLEIKPPRSWPDADKNLWATLPAQIRHRISTRETERDNGLRRSQNKLAEQLKALKPKDEAMKPVEQPKESELQNG